MPKRYTIAVDFDGVLHSYTTPWVDAYTIPDPPVEGAIDWLNAIVKEFEVVIFTARGNKLNGANTVRRWLADHGYTGPHLEVTVEKPAALIYLDDRGWRFEGSFPSAEEIHAFRPWNQSHKGP